MLVSTLDITSSSGTQSVQFSCKLSLRFDERGSVITHWLVSAIRILSNEGVDSSDQNQDQKDQGEGSVDNEEYNTHYTSDQTRLVEDIGEEK